MADETGGDEEAEQPDLERQMETAADAIRAAVLRLLKEGEAHPRVIVFAVARVAGELGAAAALAAGEDAGEVLEGLAGVVREAGLEHHEMLRAVTLPVAGSA
jgi:hypothetical protein